MPPTSTPVPTSRSTKLGGGPGDAAPGGETTVPLFFDGEEFPIRRIEFQLCYDGALFTFDECRRPNPQRVVFTSGPSAGSGCVAGTLDGLGTSPSPIEGSGASPLVECDFLVRPTTEPGFYDFDLSGRVLENAGLQRQRVFADAADIHVQVGAGLACSEDDDCQSAVCRDALNFDSSGSRCCVSECPEFGQCARSTGFCCGNGIVDALEECDDGNAQQADACTTACTIPGTAYAGTCQQGLLKTTDGGATWVGLNLPLTNVSTVVVDDSSPGTVYAGGAGGVYRSTNAGETWEARNEGLPGLFVSALAVDVRAPGTVYAGLPTYGVFKSIDGGGSWMAWSDGLNSLEINALVVDPRGLGAVHVGTEQGIARRIDGETTWVTTYTGSPATGLVADLNVVDTLYAGSSGVLGSTNAGMSWSPLNVGAPPGTAPGNVTAIAIDPSSSTGTLFVGERLSTFFGLGGVYRSTNHGGSWIRVNTGLTNQDIRALAVDPDHFRAVFAGAVGNGSQGRLYKTGDRGVQWNERAFGSVCALAVARFQPPGPVVTRVTCNGMLGCEVAIGEPFSIEFTFSDATGDAATWSISLIRNGEDEFPNHYTGVISPPSSSGTVIRPSAPFICPTGNCGETSFEFLVVVRDSSNMASDPVGVTVMVLGSD